MVIQLKSVVFEKVSGLGRAMPKIRKQSFQLIAAFWLRDILKKHFESSSRHEYQYLQRDQEYIKAKRIFGRGQGKVNDLILSGQSRRFLMHGARIKATSTGVTIRMDSPLYFRNPKYKTPGHPDKADEVTRVSGRDRLLIGRKLEQSIVRLGTRALRNTAARKAGKG